MQSTLFNFGVKRSSQDAAASSSSSEHEDCQIQISQSEGSENNSDAESQSISPRVKRVRQTWNDSWFISYPWVEKVNLNDTVVAKCKWCADSKRKNVFTVLGSDNLQNSTFSRHQATRDHLLASQARTAKQQKETVLDVVESMEGKIVHPNDSKRAQINTMYYITKEGQPLNQYHNLLKLQMKNMCPNLQDQAKIYSSESIKSDLVDAISLNIEEQVDNNINGSEFIGLIIDESTDITVFKKLNVYVKCLVSEEIKVHFVDCINVPDGKAETIVSEIVKLFERKDISFNKLVTLASDGASVMIGRNAGVGVRLKQMSPHLIQIHCIAHKLALAAGQACRDVPLLSEYQQTLKTIYRFFSNSAVRYNELRAVVDVLQDENIKYLTLKEPASFRWLSLENAVEAIYSCYPALYNALEHEAAKGQGNAEAKGLLNKVKNVTFVLLTGFLKDVLGTVGRLSKLFQRQELDISVVNAQLKSVQAKLTLMNTEIGAELESVYGAIDSNSVYRGVKLTDRGPLRMQFMNSSSEYLDKLLLNLQNRFDTESMKNVQMMNSVLNPSCLPTGDSALKNYGITDLSQLCTIYGGDGGVINSRRAMNDFFEFKITLKSISSLSLTQACKHIIKMYSDIYPDFATLATILLVSPLTSVACERGFSIHNYIKTKVRNRLGHETVTKLMRIKQEGPDLENFNPDRSLDIFCSMRLRKK